MTKENNKVDINKHEMDIDTLKKQNVNDLLSIKEIYSKLEELGEKITQVKYIDNTLVKKLKKEYEKLKKIILDENIQVQLDNKIDEFNLKLTNGIETINSQLEDIENRKTTIYITDYPKLSNELDDTNRIKRAIDTIKNNGGGTLYFKNGIYNYTDLGNIAINNLKIIGEDSKKTILKCNSLEIDNYAINLNGFEIGNSFKENIRIENITIEGNSETSCIIFAQGLARCIFKNVNVREGKQGQDASSGFKLCGVMLSKFENCYCSTNYNTMTLPPYFGIFIHQGNRSAGNVGASTNNIFTNCYFEGCSIGIYIPNGDQNIFITCSPEKNLKYGIKINTESKINKFIGLGMEANGEYDVVDEGYSSSYENCYSNNNFLVRGINTLLKSCITNIVTVESSAKNITLLNTSVNGWGNTTKPFIDNGYGTKLINVIDRHNEDDVNINRRTAIKLTGSPFTFTNTTGNDITIYIQSGTLSKLTIKKYGDKGDVIMSTTTPNSFMLSNKDSFTATYSVEGSFSYIKHIR